MPCPATPTRHTAPYQSGPGRTDEPCRARPYHTDKPCPTEPNRRDEPSRDRPARTDEPSLAEPHRIDAPVLAESRRTNPSNPRFSGNNQPHERYIMLTEFAVIRDKQTYRATVGIRFCADVHGGIPAVNLSDVDLQVAADDPTSDQAQTVAKRKDLMAVWLRTKLADKMTEDEIAELAEKTFDEAFNEASEAKSCTFKSTDEGVLYLEGRQVKALIKEAGSRMGFGKAVKGQRPSLKQDLHEAVHVDEDVLLLTRDGEQITSPDGVETRPIHVMGPQGPRTAIKSVDYVTRAEIRFTCRVLKHCGVTVDVLKQILAFAQDLGLGADRSQGAGKFEVIEFEVDNA